MKIFLSLGASLFLAATTSCSLLPLLRDACTEGERLCIESQVVLCKNGTLTQQDEACLLGCGDNIISDGEQCEPPGGLTCDALCQLIVPPNCGDGIVQDEEGERCDDANHRPGDGCRVDCLGLEVCGDGLFDLDELCDDGNNTNGDGCDAQCNNARCNNGIQEPGEVCFLPAKQRASTTESTILLAAADIDGDQDQDLITASTLSANIEVLRNEAGDFVSLAVVPTAALVSSLKIADLNVDGFDDIIVGTTANQTTLLFFGNAQANLENPTNLQTTLSTTESITIGDFTRDGILDLVVSNTIDTAIQLIPGLGEQLFDTTLPGVELGLSPVTISSADLDKDGADDLVIVDTDKVVTAVTKLETAAPALAPITSNALQAFPIKLESALDELGIVVMSSDAVQFFTQAGGLFSLGNVQLDGVSGDQLLIKDLDGDNDDDLTLLTSNTAQVFENTGGLVFGPKDAITSGANALLGATLEDLNQDDLIDLAVSNDTQEVALLFQQANLAQIFIPDLSPFNLGEVDAVSSADFDQDGLDDFVFLQNNLNRVLAFFQSAPATFTQRVNADTDSTDFNPVATLVTEINNDAQPDLLIATNGGAGFIDVFSNAGGDLFFFTTIPFSALLQQTISADLNKDGNTDVIAGLSDGKVGISSGSGDGNFDLTPTELDIDPVLAQPVTGVAAQDIDADGLLDLVVVDQADRVKIFLQKNNDTFTPFDIKLVESAPSQVIAADTDRDNDIDLVVVDDTNNALLFLQNIGDGASAESFVLTQEIGFPGGAAPLRVAVADIDDDQSVEVLVLQGGSDKLSVLVQRGDLFVSRRNFTVEQTPSALSLGDFSLDGALDLVTSNKGSGSLSFLFSIRH